MCCHIVRRASLKLKRQAFESGFLPSHLINHLTTTLIRGQFFKPFFFAVQHANASWTIHLMPTKSIKITIQSPDIHFEVRCALCAIYQHRNAMIMSYFDDAINRINRTQHIAHMGYTDDFGTRRDELFQLVDTQKAVIGDGYMLHHNAALHGLKLPGNNV